MEKKLQWMGHRKWQATIKEHHKELLATRQSKNLWRNKRIYKWDSRNEVLFYLHPPKSISRLLSATPNSVVTLEKK